MDRTEHLPGVTIDELARRTRLTVRNIRAYQSRGLVPPPELRGRTGYYSEDHVARIELIRELDLDELQKSWGERADPRILARALELGLLRELGGGRYEERSPRLGRAGLELAQLGVEAETGLDVIATARRHAEGVAEAYVQLFLNEIWKPFVAEGRPQERWPEVRDALERLRPLAAEVLLAVFGLAMTEATERAFGRELELIQEEVRREEAA